MYFLSGREKYRRSNGFANNGTSLYLILATLFYPPWEKNYLYLLKRKCKKRKFSIQNEKKI